MTTKELAARLKIEKVGAGSFKVTDTKNGWYTVSHNTLAIDRINSDEDVPATAVRNSYTLKGAYVALYNEIH